MRINTAKPGQTYKQNKKLMYANKKNSIEHHLCYTLRTTVEIIITKSDKNEYQWYEIAKCKITTNKKLPNLYTVPDSSSSEEEE